MSDFKKLKVWRKAHSLAMNVNRAGDAMRGNRHAAVRTQMVRAALSIPTNIVEGTGHQSRREFARFLRIALSSGAELEYHLIVAHDIKAISAIDYASLQGQTVEVKKRLHGLLAFVAGKGAKKSPEVLT